jgi:hypothetical protein
VVSGDVVPAHPSRRELIAGGAILAGGVVAVGCGAQPPAASHPTIPLRAPRGAAARADLAILAAALAMERRTLAAYAACIPLLDRAQAHWAQAFALEENQQVGAIAKLISLVGGETPTQNGEPAIGHPRTGAQALALLAALEAEQIRRYLGWMGRLSGGAVRAGVASVLASDAQHITALRRARGGPALESAFVLGGAGAP